MTQQLADWGKGHQQQAANTAAACTACLQLLTAAAGTAQILLLRRLTKHLCLALLRCRRRNLSKSSTIHCLHLAHTIVVKAD
jgi:hypothetical protein